MGLYVYAFVSEGPAAALAARGVQGEELRLVELGEVRAVVGELDTPPAVDREALTLQNQALQTLGERFPALLPTRFGQWVKDEQELVRWIGPRSGELVGGLGRVRGCIQMTLRVFAGAEWKGEAEAATRPQGEGARYLRSRRTDLPSSLMQVRRELAPLLRAEHLLRGQPPLLATAHDLVSRPDEGAYRDAVARWNGGNQWSVRMSGPWPPYAFTPGLPG